MCGRYYIGPDSGAGWVREMMREIKGREDCRALLPRLRLGDMFPGGVSPVFARGGPRLMIWGFSGERGRLVSVRSETALEKPLLHVSMLTRRCLVPADGYYEWKRTPAGARTKRRFVLSRGRQPLLLAGLWREEGEAPAFVLLTREAPPGLAEIHGRMPVVLPLEARREWLAGGDPLETMKHALDDLSCRPV